MALSNFDSRVTRLFLDAGMQNVDGNEALFFNGENSYQMSLDTTEMNFGFRAANQTVRGSRRVHFNKMKLDVMFKHVAAEVFCYTPRTTREVADELIKRYGLPLKREWFVETAIPANVGNQPEFTITLTFLRTLFTRQPEGAETGLVVKVKQADVDIKDIFKSTVLSTPVMPYVVRQGYSNVETLTYGRDFTPNTVERYNLLKAISSSIDLYGTESPSAERSQNLVELLSDRTNVPATTEADQDGKLCLLRATLIHNGPTVGFAGANTWYDNVLVFDTILDPIDSAARDYRGRAYVHYNNLI